MTGLPTGRQLFTRWSRLSGGISALSVIVIAAYVLSLLRMPPEQVRGFLWIVAAAFVILFALSTVLLQRIFRPLMQVLDRPADAPLEPEVALLGFAEAANLPLRAFGVGLVWWLGGGLFVAAAMKLRFAGFSVFSFWMVLAAALSGGLISVLFTFHALKRLLAPVRDALGSCIADPGARGALVRKLPVGLKLTVTVTGVMTVSMVFALLLAHVQASRRTEVLANRIQVAVLADAAQRMVSDGSLPELRDTAVREGLGTRLVLLDPEALGVQAGPGDALSAGELSAISDLAGDTGSSSSFDSEHVFAWRRVEGGILVAVAPWDQVRGPASAGSLALFALFAIGLAVLIARVAAYDVTQVIDPLARELERVAAGDLTRGRVIESEDELGEFSRGVERMIDALHETVARVVQAARGVESTASSLSAVSEDLGSVTQDQVEGLRQVSDSMGRIRGEVGGIAESAHALSLSVEESSSTVLELGTTGEQLNQNAVALTERVSEVSGSIEQMMDSARLVLGGIEELAGASAETSSSMEEMAASMREVDSNAAETARLSEDVVQIADRGRQKVDQTIQGMNAIQDATDTAQRVIHSLGSRADEIGQILNVIDDVADETNLLALNAAIIAAQAGDQGRAFSVVADEIKDLADKVLASTKEIGGLIRGVQEEATNAVGAIETGARSVESGVNLSAEAGVALEEITTSARQSGERISEIVNAVREQSRAAAHVVSLMDEVREGAERIRGAGGEQSSGNEVVLRSAAAMREVSLQVGGATEEQARGAHRMREAVESVRGSVDQINQSLREQSNACEQIASLLERVSARTNSNESSAGRMREATRGLLEHAEGLRESVRHFRV